MYGFNSDIYRLQTEAEQAAIEKRTYTYKGYSPYGAGDIFALDSFLSDEYFSENVTEFLIRENGAKFEKAFGNLYSLVIDGKKIAFYTKRETEE